ARPRHRRRGHNGPSRAGRALGCCAAQAAARVRNRRWRAYIGQAQGVSRPGATSPPRAAPRSSSRPPPPQCRRSGVRPLPRARRSGPSFPPRQLTDPRRRTPPAPMRRGRARRASAAIPQQAALLAFPVAILLAGALVVRLLALGEANQKLRNAALVEIELERRDRAPL